ncbi:MAG: tripartite tricarboxylate transporter substrate-binding protein [Rubrivivax sp.]|nr:tripartite tricarboxylate transporter substrate-binding protein [Rubrivivax sp.]
MLQRRQATIAAASLLLGRSSWAQVAASAPSVPLRRQPPEVGPASPPTGAGKVADKPRIVIPASAGGGWDTTGRMLGASLVACGAAREIEYENKGGKGGTLGLVHFVETYDADPNALLIGGMVMLGAVALHRPSADIARVQPLVKLTSEYLIIVVATDSKWQKLADLAGALRADVRSIAIAGGSAGGIDHMFAGSFVRTISADPKQMNYQPFASGKDDVVGVLTSGKAQVAITGLGDLDTLLKTGKVRVLAVSSRRPFAGLATLREQGVSTDMSNWRGVFAGLRLPAARHAELQRAVEAAAAHPTWAAAVKQNKLEGTLVTGSNFAQMVENDMMIARVMVFLLGLKA